jgi:hypothetical protein
MNLENILLAMGLIPFFIAWGGIIGTFYLLGDPWRKK